MSGICVVTLYVEIQYNMLVLTVVIVLLIRRIHGETQSAEEVERIIITLILFSLFFDSLMVVMHSVQDAQL